MNPLQAVAATIIAAVGPVALAAPPSTTVVAAEAVEWQALNPARGDQSPRAGTLWGDRNGTSATGFLVQFRDGFSSPPHIHNVTYRGVVISGLVHNDDPNADAQWMPAGSFWTQPRGAAHITSAKGSEVVAYIEIDEGPYLVRPVDQAFDNDEVPINVDASNIVWLGASSVARMPPPRDGRSGAEVAFLWGDPQDAAPSGALVALPGGFEGTIRGLGASFTGVVVQGRAGYRAPGGTDATPLAPGSYVGSTGPATHRVSCLGEERCVLYVRSEGAFEIRASGR